MRRFSNIWNTWITWMLSNSFLTHHALGRAKELALVWKVVVRWMIGSMSGLTARTVPCACFNIREAAISRMASVTNIILTKVRAAGFAGPICWMGSASQVWCWMLHRILPVVVADDDGVLLRQRQMHLERHIPRSICVRDASVHLQWGHAHAYHCTAKDANHVASVHRMPTDPWTY